MLNFLWIPFGKINCNEKITNVRASEVEKVILREVQNGYKFIYKEDEIPIMAIGCDTEIEVFYTLVLKKINPVGFACFHNSGYLCIYKSRTG